MSDDRTGPTTEQGTDGGRGGRVLPHWYSPGSDPPTLTRGDGSRVYDADGREYLDFVSQLYCVNAGHGNEAIASAVAEQARTLAYASPAKHSDVRGRLADALVEVAPDGLSEVFFSVSGSEANEAAVQFAREHADAPTVLTRWRSYHGATYGAGALTGDPAARTAVESHAATTGAGKFLPPLPGAFDADDPETLSRRAVEHLEFVVRNQGPDSVAAVLTEPVGGTSGAYTAPPGYFDGVRDVCDEYDLLLIADEVITGFGRCGDWFGVGTEGIEPDLLTFAKGVTSAYVPLGGVIARPEVVAHVREGGTGLGQTFGGHPVACAAGLAALEEYRDGLVENAADLAPRLADGLADLAGRHDAVSAVRGRGFLRAVEFAEPATGEPFVDPWVEPGADNPVEAVVRETRERGALVGSGRPATQVVLAPPLCADAAEIDDGVAALDGAIEAVFG